MRIHKVHISNMFCFGQDQQLVLKSPVYQVIGIRDDIDAQSNGTGKSSLYYVIQEVLFGKNSKGTLKDYTGNIYTNPQNYSATVEFEHNGHNYKVKLERKSGKPKLKLYQDNIDISANTVPKTYKLISDILGIDFELFTMLTYLSPTNSTPNILFFGSPKEKRQLFIKLFNLTEITTKTVKAREHVQELNTQIKVINNTLNSYKDIQIPDALPAPDYEKLKELETKLDELKSLQRTAEKIRTITEIKEKIEKVRNELEKIPDVKEVQDLSTLKEKLVIYKTRLQNLTQELKKLQQIKEYCYVCGSKIKDFDAVQERIKELRERIQKGTDILAQEKKVYAEKEKQQRDYERKVKLENTLRELQQRLQDIGAENLDFVDINSLRSEIEKTKNAITEFKQYETKYIKRKTSIEVLTQMQEEKRAESEKLKSDLEKLKDELWIYKIIADNFDSRYINTEVSNMAIGLVDLINTYLSIFSDNTLIIRLVNPEKLIFKLLKDDKELPVNNLSAGQTTILQLSAILALRDLTAAWKGISIDLLVLDELFGTLDQLRRSVLIDLVRQVSVTGAHKILSISHLHYEPSIPVITVRQSNGISTIHQ